jgi:hypothetical protein
MWSCRLYGMLGHFLWLGVPSALLNRSKFSHCRWIYTDPLSAMEISSFL